MNRAARAGEAGGEGSGASVSLEALRSTPAEASSRGSDSLLTLLDQLRSIWPVAAGPAPDRPGSGWGEVRARFGRFELHELLGRGGYGLVYRAVDTRLHRQVALKLPGPDGVFDPVAAASLLREARAAASLSHPNTVRVLEVGQEGPVWFVVMEYCERGSLAQRIAATGPLPPAEAAELVAQLATGIQHAHDRGILHRDLKPSNVLLRADHARPGEGGEPPLVALASDFGLARIEADESLTPAGFPLGTRPYMAPEQARGEVGLIGRSADVYGIGVVLFEALTGRRPFEAASAEELLARIQTDPAPAVRSLRPAVPRDLDRIVRNCLEKEQADRYPSAAELAVDLGRFLRGEPLLRRRAPWRVARSWARRHPMPVAVVAAIVLVAGLVVPLAERRALDRAEGQVGRLVAAEAGELPRLFQGIDTEDDRIARAARPMLDDPRAPTRLRASILLVPHGDRDALSTALDGLDGAGPEEVSLLARAIGEGLAEGTAEEAIGGWLRESVDEGRGGRMLRLSRLLQESGGTIPGDLAEHLIAALAAEEDPFPWAGHLPRSRSAGELALRKSLAGGDGRAGLALVALYAGDVGAYPELAELLCTARVDRRRVLLDGLSSRVAWIASPDDLHAALESIAEGRSGDQSDGRERAGAAIALLRLDGPGAWARVDRMLEAGSEPAARAHLVHLLGPLGIGPEQLVARLAGGSSAGPRASLVLALGNTPLAGFGDDQEVSGADWLLRAYEFDPDPMVHSACKWLLRKWAAEEPAVAVRLAAIDARLAAGGVVDPARGWWVHPTGITFVRVPLPGLGRVVEVSDTEVTVAQLRRWRQGHPTSDALGHDPEGPACYIDCSGAVGFCDWLSELGGLGADARPSGLDPAGLKFPDPSALAKPGYRLLTEEEYVTLGRAGSPTTWHFGDSEELLASYAWYTANSGSRVHRVASLMPNDYGLFDTLGNAMEWCAADPSEIEFWPRNQVVMGGGYVHRADQVRASHRLELDISFGGSLTITTPIGFRVARTLPGPAE